MDSLNTTIQATANLGSIKTVDKSFANIGDTLTYKIEIKNTGTTDAINLIVTDLIPQGANFVTNSVKINGVTQTGVDPALGINVGTIVVGATTTILLNALVVTLPFTGNLVNNAQLDYQYIDLTTTPSTINVSIDSNNAVTTINTVISSVVKTVSETALLGAGQILNYTLRITNTGNVTATNLVIIDTIPTGTTFVPGSISIMGTPAAGTVEPPGGFTFGALRANAYTTLSFKVTVNSIPANKQISNQGFINYNYTVDPITPTTASGGSLSNIVTLSQLNANLSGITKSVDKAFVTIGDIITYTITIPNSGNTTAFNVIIIDTIPNGTSYVSNSLIVNGVTSPNSPSSINVGTIAAGAISTIQFQVKVN